MRVPPLRVQCLESRTNPNSVQADLLGNGVIQLAEIVPQATGTLFRLSNSRTGAIIAEQFAFEPTFTGDATLVVVTLTGIGANRQLAYVPTDGGAARVRVFGLQQRSAFDPGTLMNSADFFGIDDVAFRGGASIVAADFNGDGRSDLAIGAGPGGGPRVAIFDGATDTRLSPDFFAFPDSATINTNRDGIRLATGDLNTDSVPDLLVLGGGSFTRLSAFSGSQLVSSSPNTFSPLADFFVADLGANLTVSFEATDGGTVRVSNPQGDFVRYGVRQFPLPPGQVPAVIESAIRPRQTQSLSVPLSLTLPRIPLGSDEISGTSG